MTQDERDQLDAICREAMAKINDMDLRLYQLGFLGKPQNSWGKRAMTTSEAPKPVKPKSDIGGTKVLKPVTPPKLGPSGNMADADALARVSAFVNRQTIN